MRAHLAAAGAITGAWWAPTVSWWVAAVILGAIWVARQRRRSLAVVIGALVLSAASTTHARASLDFPDAGPFDGWVTLIDDPRTSGPVGVRVTVRAGDRHLLATAHGAVAGRLDDALAGERLHLVGTVRPAGRGDARSIHRHVVGRITVDAVEGVGRAAPVGALANSIRRMLDDGAVSLSRSDRALFLGMVIGDDRGQTPVTADDFRAAGLGHLLVVSGQNVAFVLAVAMPVAGRLRPGGRALVLFTMLGLFAVLTRFEPSVLRATAMAGVGIGSTALGRPSDGRAGLSWAIAGLLVLDPFLVHVVAFRLSAAATAGIVWMGGPLAERLPGPAWLTIPVSTTVAAQIAVAPVLIAVFGPIPLASLPANVLAGPVSGAVMIWGCTAGVVAGVVGGAVAEGIHWPMRVLLWWVSRVAEWSAQAPTATVGGRGVGLLAVAVVVLARGRSRRGALGAMALASLVCLSAIGSVPSPGRGETELANGVVIHHHGDETVIVLDDPGSPQAVLEGLRTAGVRRPVLIIARDGDRSDADAVLALHSRFGPVPVAAPPLHRVPGGRVVQVGQIVPAGAISLMVVDVLPRLEVAFLDPGSGR